MIRSIAAGIVAMSLTLAPVPVRTPPADRVPVIVMVNGGIDPVRVPGASRHDRQRAVVQALRDRATTAQRDLMKYLSARAKSGQVADVTPLWIVNAVALSATAHDIARLRARKDVVAVVPERQVVLPATALSAAAEPNIGLVNAPALWNLGVRGQGVVVATLDSGVDVTHPDLASRWRGGTNSWYDPNGEHPSGPVDVSGHGTATMGVLVGGDAAGTSIGMAPDARWISVKIFNDRGVATSTNIHKGLQWLLDPDDNPATADAPDVVSNSWSMSAAGCTLDFQPDLANLRSAGILPIFSAGNYGPTPGTVLSPANNPAAFPVGATDNADGIASFSSRGPSACDQSVEPKLVAPGVDIPTTDLYGQYTTVSGTSLAAPHAAGALALLLSAYPGLSADQQAAALTASARDLGDAGPDNTFGYGRLDALAAYQWLQSHPAPADFALTVTPASRTATAGASATYTAMVAGAPGFTDAVGFSLAGLPASVGTAAFIPASVTANGTAQLTITTSAYATPGTYPLTVTATGGGQVHASAVNLVVKAADFTMAASPSSLTIARGQTGTTKISLASAGGFFLPVSLAVTGLPAAATGSFAPNPVAVPGSSTLTVRTTSNTPRGTYVLSVAGAGGQVNKKVSVVLTVT